MLCASAARSSGDVQPDRRHSGVATSVRVVLELPCVSTDCGPPKTILADLRAIVAASTE